MGIRSEHAMIPSRVMRQGASQVLVGNFNQTLVLDAIRRSKDGISRVELTESTGLSAQTVSNIARQLLDAGLIRVASRTPIARGKPRTKLALEPTGQYAIGVHLDPAVITYVILDLTGKTVAQVRQITPTTIDPVAIISEMAAEIDQLVTEAAIDRERIVGVGIAAPGPIDIEQGIVVDPPHLTGWKNVPLRDALHKALGLPVLLDKDVTAAAAAQKWVGGSQGDGSFLFFYIGTGVGAGVVLNDQVVRGSSYNLGEIGHMIADPDGPPCECGKPCGRRGCIGGTSQASYLVQLGIDAGVLNPSKINFGDRQQLEAALADLSQAAVKGDEQAKLIMVAWADRVCNVVEDVANLLDLDRVVIGGPHWSSLAPFFDDDRRTAMNERFEVHKIHSFEVTGTYLGTDVGAVGAASLVLDRTFTAVSMDGARPNDDSTLRKCSHSAVVIQF